MPFGDECQYADFDTCVSANSDKDDPDAFCAVLMQETEEQCNMTDNNEETLAKLPIDVCRSAPPALEVVRAEGTDGDMPKMTGHFSTFNDWYEINSWIEGHFMERIAPGAFKRTFNAAASSKDKHRISVLLEHGMDPQVGDKPLGIAESLSEDGDGARFEVPLFDTSYNRDLVPALEAGAYGSSFRFAVINDEWDFEPDPSDENPRGIPERTLTEVRVPEFGPTVFPANPSATAGLRSTTDEYYEAVKRRDQSKYNEVLRNAAQARGLDEADLSPDNKESESTDPQVEHSTDSRDEVEAFDAPSTHSEDPQHEHSDPDNENRSEEEASAETQEVDEQLRNDNSHREEKNMADENTEVFEVERKTVSERESRVTEIESRLKEINTEFDGAVLPEDVQTEWDNLRSERHNHLEAIDAAEQRQKELEELDGTQLSARTERATKAGTSGSRKMASSRQANTVENRVPRDMYNLAEYRSQARTLDDLTELHKVGAKRAIEEAAIPGVGVDHDAAKKNALRLLDTVDDKQGTLAQRVLTSGSPVYQRAFGKAVMAGSDAGLSTEERAALAAGSDGAGGFAVPFTLDPSLILTDGGSINPLRAISRVVQISTSTWQGVATEGITVSRDAEADEVSDDGPTITQPTATPTRVQGFVPFSIEIDQDWSAMRSEMTMLLNDAKEQEEASSFVTGDGSGQAPNGVVGSLDSGSVLLTSSGLAFGSEDVYALEEALPPRFRQRGRFLAAKSVYNAIRQFADADGHDLWERLGAGQPAALLGYPAHEASEMDSFAVSGGENLLLFGDFSQFVIVDRVGMNVELVPHLFGSSNRFPTGQRGLYAIWRNTSVITADNAFRLLQVNATT